MMMRCLAILGLMNFFLISTLKSQTNLDSLRNIWQNPKQSIENRFDAINQFYLKNTFDKPSASAAVAKEHLNLAKENKNLRQTIKAFNEMAIINSLLGKPDSSLFYIEESIEIAEQLNDSTLLGKLYINHGNALRDADQLREAVKRFQQGLSIFETLNKELLYQADANNNLGLIYLDVGLYEIAKLYMEKALSLYKQVKGNKAIGNIWLNLGQIHFKLGEISQAKAAINQAIPMLLDEANSNSSAHAYLIAASIFEQEQKLDSASYFLDLGLKKTEEFGNDNSILEALIEKLNFQFKHGLSISAEQKERVAQLLKLATYIQTKANAARLLYTLYKSERKDAKAFEMLELYTLCSDSINLERERFSIIRETIQSDFDNKILQQKIENERAQLKTELIYLKKMFAFALVFLITLTLVIEYFRKRTKANIKERSLLLEEIDQLKTKGIEDQNQAVSSFELNRDKLEAHIQKKMNETDWAVLNVLLENPVISNKELSEKVFLSSDGVGSSLRRMYVVFDVPESKYMKIGLLLKAIKISNC
jgi:tetratricopeptide (TPR) repeat protein